MLSECAVSSQLVIPAVLFVRAVIKVKFRVTISSSYFETFGFTV